MVLKYFFCQQIVFVIWHNNHAQRLPNNLYDKSSIKTKKIEANL